MLLAAVHKEYTSVTPRVCDSNKPGTNTVIPRVDTAPHGVETPTPLADWWVLVGCGS